jgi:Xaa-Pro aminopeptidase
MLTAEGCHARRSRLWDAVPEEVEALVITSPESLIYLANYAPSPFVFNTVESAAALILYRDRSILVGDNLLQAFLDRSFADEVVALEWYTGKTSTSPRRQRLAEAVGERISISAGTGRRIGVESMGPGSMGFGPDPAFLLDPLIRGMRRNKDLDELVQIRKSARAGEAAHSDAMLRIKAGMTELDAYLIVQAAAARECGEQVLVYGDFPSGPRCATDRGGPPTRRKIESGDLLLLDFSVVVHGYRTDFTNTFVVDGEPTPRQVELYQICMGALEAGESLLRPGTTARDVDTAVRGHFRSHGVEAYFPSHSGHGLGLGHPEPPYLVPESDDVLQEGDVIALEPGLYLPGVGGMRFERNYLITAEGHELLTRHRLAIAP